MHMRLSEMAAAVEGRLVGDDVTVNGVSIDSRDLAPGALFVPIVAERDGHGAPLRARDVRRPALDDLRESVATTERARVDPCG